MRGERLTGWGPPPSVLNLASFLGRLLARMGVDVAGACETRREGRDKGGGGGVAVESVRWTPHWILFILGGVGSGFPLRVCIV